MYDMENTEDSSSMPFLCRTENIRSGIDTEFRAEQAPTKLLNTYALSSQKTANVHKYINVKDAPLNFCLVWRLIPGLRANNDQRICTNAAIEKKLSWKSARQDISPQIWNGTEN